jgi:hypothetical protein
MRATTPEKRNFLGMVFAPVLQTHKPEKRSIVAEIPVWTTV